MVELIGALIITYIREVIGCQVYTIDILIRL